MGKNKGFTGLETVLAIAVLGALIGLFAPKTIASLGDIWNGGNKNQTKQVHKIDVKTTMGYMDEKGKFVKVGDYSKKEDMENVIAQQAPEKWSTKVKIILGFVIILAIAFPAKALQMYFKAKDNITQIVTGIEQAKKVLPPTSVATLQTNLSMKMDSSAKDAVSAIKEKLPATDIATPVVTPPTGV
jgi:hypothetical protein